VLEVVMSKKSKHDSGGKVAATHIHSRFRAETAACFRELAEAAERGECIGALVVPINQSGSPYYRMIGVVRDKKEAHWVLSQASQDLLSG
jgi:hypothetical protein